MGMIRGVPTGGSLRLFREMPMLRAQGIMYWDYGMRPTTTPHPTPGHFGVSG